MIAKLTRRQAIVALKWFLRAVSMEDWRINIETCELEPTWEKDGAGVLGSSNSHADQKYARIWVAPTKCRDDNEDGLKVLFHEALHVLMVDLGIEGKGQHIPPQHHHAWDKIAGIMAFAYRHRMKA